MFSDDATYRMQLNSSWLWQEYAASLERSACVLQARILAARRRQRALLVETFKSSKKTGASERDATPEEVELHCDTQMTAQFLMLLGMSIEASCKGILIQIEGDGFIEPPKSGKKQKKAKILTHDVLELVESVGKHAEFSLTPGERDFLRLLSEHIVWLGRYPVPVRKEFLVPTRPSTGRKFGFFINVKEKLENSAQRTIIQKLNAVRRNLKQKKGAPAVTE